MKRVMVTGIGVLTPIGFNAGDFARGLCEGRSGIGPIAKFETADFPIKRAFEIKGWTLPEWMPEEDLFIQYALAVSDEALRDAGFDTAGADPSRVGVVMSSSKGGVMTIDAILRKKRFLKDGGNDILN
ncbi:MAG: beta-ketoacyl synthase N-terminal-like domain-containing protein, partial [Candidatus Omnitrophica bacterium]|nr:beta-ketoacyl synthase N-terminal-like domain-containing protein [Candidatus Omnitrophota bacterium]